MVSSYRIIILLHTGIYIWVVSSYTIFGLDADTSKPCLLSCYSEPKDSSRIGRYIPFMCEYWMEQFSYFVPFWRKDIWSALYFDPTSRSRDLSLPQCVQTGSESYPASYWMGTSVSFSGGKGPGRETHLHVVQRLRMIAATYPPPIWLYSVYRENFTKFNRIRVQWLIFWLCGQLQNRHFTTC